MPEDLGAISATSAVIPSSAAATETPIRKQNAGRTRRAWQRAKLWSKRALAVSTTISTGLLAVWIVWLVGEATLRKHSLNIESIAVPKQLTDAGFSAEVVTRRLRDAIKKVQVQASATTTVAGNRVDVQEDIPDITIPKAGISTESMAASIRRLLLPDTWQHEASGEFVLSGAELGVRLRLNGEVIFSDASTDLNAVDALIDRAAFKLVESTQPFIAAALLYGKGDLSGSAHLADKIIDSLPSDDENVIRAYNLKGNIAANQHEDKNAVAFYLKYPNSALARYNLGLLYDHQHNIEEAISNYSLATQLDPQFLAAHINLGIVLYTQGKIDEAIREYRLAIQLAPKFWMPHDKLGRALRRQGKLDEAISEYRLAIRFAPRLTDAHIDLGNALYDQDKADEAISEYRLAMQLDPNEAMPHNKLGFALDHQGKADEAISEYRLAIQLDPKSALAHYNLAKILAEQVGPETPQDRAMQHLTEACKEILLGASLARDDPDYPIVARGIDAKFAGRGHCLPP
jgi:tetratricopeptide (TPR) repeat protein